MEEDTLEVFVMEKVALGEVCIGKGGTRRGLYWKRWH